MTWQALLFCEGKNWREMKNARADITGRPFFMGKKKGIPEYRVRKKTKEKQL